MKANFETLLYAEKYESFFSNLSVRKMGPNGIGLSKWHPSSSGSVKVNIAIKFLDLLIENNIAIYKDDDIGTCYVEIVQSDSNRTSYYVSESGSVSLDKKDTGNEILIPFLVYQLLYGNNEELKNTLKEYLAVKDKSSQLVIVQQLLFCDSFYYGTKQMILEENGFTFIDYNYSLQIPHIMAAFRCGSFEKVNFYESDKSITSVYDIYNNTGTSSEKSGCSNGNDDFLNDCKEGCYFVPYTWKDDQLSYIQSLEKLEGFVPNSTFKSILKKIEIRTQKVLKRIDNGLSDINALGNDYINLLMVGKPGTGKTALAYALSAATQMPVYTINLSQNTDEDEFEGKTKIVNGKPEFVSTDFLKAFENGGIVILEEPNLANPAVVMGALGQAIEFPFILKKNGYETIRRHPLCIIIGAMNIGTVGSKQLSQAFANRFKQTYILNDPSREQFIDILCKKTGESRKKCDWVYSAYESITNYLRSPEVNAEDICMNLSIRTCLGCIECMEEGDKPREAVLNTMIGAIAEADLDIAESAKKEVFRTLKNY